MTDLRRRAAFALRWLAGQLDDQRRPAVQTRVIPAAPQRSGVAFARHVCGTLLSGLPHTTVACGACGGSTVLGEAHPSTLLAPVIPLRGDDAPQWPATGPEGSQA